MSDTEDFYFRVVCFCAGLVVGMILAWTIHA